jgi:hypothetical protein
LAAGPRLKEGVYDGDRNHVTARAKCGVDERIDVHLGVRQIVVAVGIA